MLEIRGVTKSFGSRRVLDDVGFTVASGRMTGFVGGNGAGKTTTMRIILGLLTADVGRVTLGGTELTASDRRAFGYMPEERGLYPKMKVVEHLVYLARLHGFSAQRAKRNADDLLERLGLAERRDEAIENLSLGNQQRAQIAASLVHEPTTLILDEPFSGLDPLAVDTVVAVLKDRADAGVPVLFSSHQLDIVERLCDDLVIIADGSVRAAGSREALRERHSTKRYEIRVSGDAGWIRGVPGVDMVDLAGGYALFGVDTDATAHAVLRRAVAEGEVDVFSPRHPSLAQIFTEVIS